MGFLSKLWTGAKIALVVANVANGRKIGKHKIQIKEVPDILDLISVVEATVQAAKAADLTQKGQANVKKEHDNGTSGQA